VEESNSDGHRIKSGRLRENVLEGARGMAFETRKKIGAGEGNRTLTSSLGSLLWTLERLPLTPQAFKRKTGGNFLASFLRPCGPAAVVTHYFGEPDQR
jgi:hypothetical protein